MSADRAKTQKLLGLSPQPEWAETWHLWKVLIPRRSITGRMVHGQVWRRHDGRRWIYKKFVEYADDRVRAAIDRRNGGAGIRLEGLNVSHDPEMQDSLARR